MSENLTYTRVHLVVVFWIVDYYFLMFLPLFASELLFKLRSWDIQFQYLPLMWSCFLFLHNYVSSWVTSWYSSHCYPPRSLLVFSFSCGLVLCFCSATHGRPHWLGSCKVQMPVDVIHTSCSATHFILRAHQQQFTYSENLFRQQDCHLSSLNW